MSTPIDTEDWRLAAYIDWRPNKEPQNIQCTYCGGSGQIGGGFKSIDGSRDCPECFGRGHKTISEISTDKPEVPKELIEHMRKAFFEYFNKNYPAKENKS